MLSNARSMQGFVNWGLCPFLPAVVTETLKRLESETLAIGYIGHSGPRLSRLAGPSSWNSHYGKLEKPSPGGPCSYVSTKLCALDGFAIPAVDKRLPLSH